MAANPWQAAQTQEPYDERTAAALPRLTIRITHKLPFRNPRPFSVVQAILPAAYRRRRGADPFNMKNIVKTIPYAHVWRAEADETENYTYAIALST